MRVPSARTTLFILLILPPPKAVLAAGSAPPAVALALAVPPVSGAFPFPVAPHCFFVLEGAVLVVLDLRLLPRASLVGMF
jgi:hypothetical protein